jgi:predicted permease
VLVGNVDLRRTGAEPDARLPLYLRMRDALASTPGIESAALSFVTPVSGSTWNLEIRVPGYSGDNQPVLYNGVTPDYFRAMGTPLLSGRDISDSDRRGTPNVAIVNDAFARKYFNGANPIGRTFTITGFTKENPDRVMEIIGLVANAKYQRLREQAQPTIYAAFQQDRDSRSSSARVAIRTTGSPWDSRAAIVQAVAGVNKEIAVDLKPFDEDLGANVLQERLVATLSAFFGVLAMLLAGLGLYGVMSYTVTRRKNEIGIRMALGAEPATVVALVLRNVAMITLAGLVAGAVAAVGTGRFINALLYNLAASDTTMIVVTAITLATAATVAGYLPARRAARIDPMSALRED